MFLSRDGHQCQKWKTKKGKLHVRHIVFQSNGGTDIPSNLIVLWESCHNKLHKGEFVIKGVKSKTQHATEIGIVKSQLKKQFGDFKETFGYQRKFKREAIFQLLKTQYFDAVAICCEESEIVDLSPVIYFKKYVSRGDYQQFKGCRSEKKTNW